MKPGAHPIVRYALATSILLLSGAAAGAETLVLRDGDDLAEAARQAADGDVIRLEAGRYPGPVVVEGKRIAIEVSDGGARAVIVPGQSNVLVGARKGGQADLSGLAFETSAETPLALFARKGGISCAGCTIESAHDQPVHVENGSLRLTGGRVSGAGKNVIVARDSQIHLEDMQVEALNGSPLNAAETMAASILRSRLSGAERTSVRGDAPMVRIADSEIAASSSYGLAFEGGGEIDIERSRMTGGLAGLVAKLGSGARMRIADVEARSPDWGIHLEHLGGDTARVTLDRVVAVGGKGVALRAIGGLDVEAGGSTFVSGGGYGVTAEGDGVRLRLEESVLASSDIPVVVSYEGPGRIELADTVTLPAEPVHHGVVPDDGTQRLSRTIADGAALAEELKAGVAGLLAGGDAAPLAMAAERARAAAAAITMVALEVADGVGAVRTAPFTVVSADSLEIVAESADGAPVPVPPGLHFVEWREDALFAAELEAKGGSATARIEVPEGLWFDAGFGAADKDRMTLLRTIPEEEVRQVFRAAAGDYAYHPRVARRVGATDAEVSAALEAARSLVAMEMTWPKNGTQADKDRHLGWNAGQWQALRVLASAGDAQDGDLIAAAINPGGTLPREILLMYLAYLENRLGMLEAGHVAAHARGQDAYVAARSLVLLDYYGVDGARERLFALAAAGDGFDSLSYAAREPIARRLIGLDDPRVGAIAGAAFTRAQAAEADSDLAFLNRLTPSFAAYLAVFGSAAQKRAIAKAAAGVDEWWAAALARPLAMIARDPLPFVEEFMDLAERNIADTGSPAACAAWRLRGEAEAAALHDMLVDAYARRYAKNAVRRGHETNTYVNEKQKYATGKSVTQRWLAPCRPAGIVAGAYYNDGHNADARLPVEALSEAMRRRPHDMAPLEAAPVEIALAAWREVDHPRWSSFRDERMAMFRAFTKAGDDEVNGNADDGIERRAYVLRHVLADGYSGALNGHLEVRPMAEEGKLVIGVRLRQAPWYNSYGGIADQMSTNGDRNHWAHHAYVLDGGRKLIERIALERAGEPVPLVEQESDPQGFRRFAAGLPAGDLSGLDLEIGLALFDDRRSFRFDLFASRLARAAQRKGTSP